MSMEVYKQHEETTTLIRMDELQEELELEIQNAISLTLLNVRNEEAFAKTFKIVDRIYEEFGKVEDDVTRMIAFLKVKESIDLLESKIPQINK